MPFRNYSAQADWPGQIVTPQGLAPDNNIYLEDREAAYGQSSPDELFDQSHLPANQYLQAPGNPNDFTNRGEQSVRPGLTADCWTSPNCPKRGTTNGPCSALGAIQCGKRSNSSELVDYKKERMASTARGSIQRANSDDAPKPGRSRVRLPHNVIERRYRNHLNSQIEALRLAVPALKEEQNTQADVDDGIPLRPPSKADIISTAATYIKELQDRNSDLLEYTRSLQGQVEGLQKLVKCDDCSILKYLTSLQLGGSPDQQVTQPSVTGV